MGHPLCASRGPLCPWAHARGLHTRGQAGRGAAGQSTGSHDRSASDARQRQEEEGTQLVAENDVSLFIASYNTIFTERYMTFSFFF